MTLVERDRRALERALPACRSTATASSAALTTYRCGGPLAVARARRAPRPISQRVAESCRGAPSRCSWSAAAPISSSPTPASPGSRSSLAGEFEQLDIDRDGGRGARPAARSRSRCSARRTAAAGLGGLEFYVGIPGSVGGAVRMNAGGHGRETERRARRGPGSARSRRRPARDVGAGELGLGYRRSALATADVVVARDVRRARPTTRRRCGARIDEIVRWRREHQPGGQNAGSVFTNPPGDAAGRLSRRPGARGCASAAPSSRRSTPTSSWPSPGATAADVLRARRARCSDASRPRPASASSPSSPASASRSEVAR